MKKANPLYKQRGRSTVGYSRSCAAVLIEWLTSIYPNSINTLDDYVEYPGRLNPQMKKLAL